MFLSICVFVSIPALSHARFRFIVCLSYPTGANEDGTTTFPATVTTTAPLHPPPCSPVHPTPHPIPPPMHATHFFLFFSSSSFCAHRIYRPPDDDRARFRVERQRFDHVRSDGARARALSRDAGPSPSRPSAGTFFFAPRSLTFLTHTHMHTLTQYILSHTMLCFRAVRSPITSETKLYRMQKEHALRIASGMV